MTVPALTITDAIVTALNAAGLSQSVTFSRVYVPKFDLENAVAIQGRVVPKSDAREMGSAAADNATVAVDIGVMKRLQGTVAAEAAELDALLLLCEEIKAVLNRQRLAGAEEAICTGTAQEMPYSVGDVEGRVFLTVITAMFLIPVAV